HTRSKRDWSSDVCSSDLYKQIAERSVTCHNIPDITLKKPIDRSSHKAVSEIMERAFIFFKISGRKPVAHNHVNLSVKYFRNHFKIGRASCRERKYIKNRA